MQDAIYYAYFAPYSYERHQDLIAKCISHQAVRLEVLGETLDGHDIDLLRIGKRHCSDVQPNTDLSCCLQRTSGPAPDNFCQTREVWVAFCFSIVAISCVTAGQPGKGKRRVWMIARQHPGESMAEWFCEGIHLPILTVSHAPACALSFLCHSFAQLS